MEFVGSGDSHVTEKTAAEERNESREKDESKKGMIYSCAVTWLRGYSSISPGICMYIIIISLMTLSYPWYMYM